MGQTEEIQQVEGILRGMEQTWARLEEALNQIGPWLESGPDAGGWTPRQLLSHLTGGWQRVPLHGAFFLAEKANVPIFTNESYWIPEWEYAPLEAFTVSLRAAYEGNRAFVRTLRAEDLARTSETRFGKTTLGEFLIDSYVSHLGTSHIPQLEAFFQLQYS